MLNNIPGLFLNNLDFLIRQKVLNISGEHTVWLSKFYDLNIDLSSKSILVTGGTGSFGKQFIKTVLERYDVKRLVVFSRDELKQYEMQQEFSPTDYPCLRYFIGDIRDLNRLTLATRDIDIIVHAAALKHVPAAEYNPTECIRTNIYGAENLVQAALANSVERVLALSTDKAVNPINLYGASKLAADKVFVAANNLSGKSNTKFSVVRYGNVLGSRGSVIPFFNRLIEEGATELPITDERMTRFWITIQQGVDFVLSSINMMQGGEIFVPKLPSMTITAMAKHLAPHLPHKNVGIRPGEKLHEVMISEDDSLSTWEVKDRYIVEPSFASWTRENIQSSNSEELPAKPVGEGFKYSSDNNTEWLTGPELDKLLKEQK